MVLLLVFMQLTRDLFAIAKFLFYHNSHVNKNIIHSFIHSFIQVKAYALRLRVIKPYEFIWN